MKKVVKKSVVRRVDEHTKEIKRYLGSLSEDFQHKVSAIGEQFSGLNNKIDRIDYRVGNVEKKLDSHTVMIGRIMIDVEEIKSGMREKVDRAEFVKLEKRLVILEATVYGGKRK